MATATAHPSITDPSVRKPPTQTWYWLAALIGIVGTALAIGWGAVRTWDAYRTIDAFDRGGMRDEVVVIVDEPGTRFIYYEGDLRPTASDLGVEVRGPSGEPVLVEPYRLDLRYDHQGRLGKAIGTFDAIDEGRYIVSTIRAPEKDALVAVGDDLTSIVPVVLWALGLASVAVATAIVITAVTYSNRSRRGAVAEGRGSDQQSSPKRSVAHDERHRGHSPFGTGLRSANRTV